MEDIEQRWHKTHATDQDAKPMLGKLSGIAMVSFLTSLALAVISFVILTEIFNIQPLATLLAMVIFVAAVLIFLLRFVVGKPALYALRCYQSHRIQMTKSPLLTAIPTDE